MLGVRKSLGGRYGYVVQDEEGVTRTLEDRIFPGDTSSMVFGQATPASSRYYNLQTEAGGGQEVSMRIVRDQPAALNVTYAIPTMEVGRG